MDSIRLKNISFGYDDDIVIDDISITIKKGHHISILGNIASGKSTLVKIFANKVKKEGTYLINDEKITLSNQRIISDNINILTLNSKFDNKLIVDILFDLLKDEDSVKKVVSYFKIKDYLNNKIKDLSIELRYYILIITKLLKEDSYLILDDILCYLNKKEVELIYKYSKKNKVTIINIASNLDYVLYSEYMICLYNGKIAMEGEVLSCLKEEKLLKRLGFKLPFMYDLSLQLNYYEVLDDIYLDYKALENEIWK